MDQLVIVRKDTKCCFCGYKRNDYLEYGFIYKLGNIQAHYYCVLLSHRLIQNGNDEEGILGFLLSDIENELQRTEKVLCIYCSKGHATIQCAAKKCRKSFHLPCGLKIGSSHEFVNQFKSFCHVHRTIQNIPEKTLRETSKTDVICCICYETVKVRDKKKTLWAPCCLKTWYHRRCVQELAYSAGYFFRCAACNDVQKFNKCMQRMGIFIPQQDASWELVPNAFEELLFRYNKCDAEECKCPEGRQMNTENTMWEIVLCESCGSQGIHVACGSLKFLDPEWECVTCKKITENMKPVKEISASVISDEGSSKLSKRTEVSHKKRRRGSEDLENSVLDKRKKCKTSVEEEDEDEIDVENIDENPEKKSDTWTGAVDEAEDIDVETMEEKDGKKTDFQNVLRSLKPGPLSYKLEAIQKCCGTTAEVAVDYFESSPNTPETIDLTSHSEGDAEVTEENKEQLETGIIRWEKVEEEEEEEEEEDRISTTSNETFEGLNFSLTDFEVVAAITFERKYEVKEEILRNLMNSVVYYPPPANADRDCSQKETTQRNLTKEEQQIDDDVVILTE